MVRKSVIPAVMAGREVVLLAAMELLDRQLFAYNVVARRAGCPELTFVEVRDLWLAERDAR